MGRELPVCVTIRAHARHVDVRGGIMPDLSTDRNSFGGGGSVHLGKEGIMKKADLIDALAGKLEESKAGTERILSAVLESIKDGLLADGVVQITGFGTFKIRTRAARMGRNPRTGEPVQIAGGKSVGFKVGKALKDSVQ